MPIRTVGMDMKIEQPRTNPREDVARTDSVTGGASRPAATGVAPQADAVRLSGDLQLASRAIQVAAAGDDRSQVVDRARALVERGDFDVDVDRLADRMLDAILHSDDDRS